MGAHLYDGGESDEGRVFVYLGSASGLSPTVAWSAESDHAGANLGYSVGTAGDVNSDGFSDLIAGAVAWDRAYVFLGSASGLGASPAWIRWSDQAGSQFGFSVGSAGDVNGDGYSDVIVGARAMDAEWADEGRAYVYLGSAAGLATTEAWSVEVRRPGVREPRIAPSAQRATSMPTATPTSSRGGSGPRRPERP